MPESTTVMPQPQGQAPQLDSAELITRVMGHLRRMRYFRRQYDQRRAGFYRQYLGQRDARKYPDNLTLRSNTFVPYPLSNVETILSRVLDAFFSFDPWFEAKPKGQLDDSAAEAMQLVLNDRLARAGLIPAFETLVRNICIYGHGGMKVDWDWDFDIVDYMEPIYLTDPATGQPVVNPMDGQPIVLKTQPAKKPVPRMQPKFIPIDIYDLLVDPDGGMVAHVTEKPWPLLQREAMANPQLYFPEGIEQLGNALAKMKDASDVLVRMAEFWDEHNNTVTIVTFGEDHEAISWKDTRASYRAASYTGFRRKVYTGQPILLYHGPNPFNHKRAPILYTSYIKLPNEPYGMGAIEIISDLTESLNTFVNMIVDNWNLGINRRYAYDTTADIDHNSLNNFNVPGGKVGVVGDPNKVLRELPTHTPEAGDYMLIGLYRGMIETTAGISDFYTKGVGAPTGNRTATGINSVIGETNYRFKMFIRNLEVDVLRPLLRLCASMVQQFVTDEIEVMSTDAQPAIPKWHVLRPEQLVGSFDFDLVAANYTTNKVVRQRNLLAFYNIARESPFWNQFEGLREIAKVFEVRNINRLVKPPEQVAAEQQQAMQQQVEMMILEALLKTASQEHLTTLKAKLTPPRQGQGKGGGRPRKSQFEGKIPGTGSAIDLVREVAQGMGANAMGMEGMSGE